MTPQRNNSMSKKEVQMHWNSKTPQEKVSILWEALDFMSQYNGRSRFDCVAYTMGFKKDSEEDDKWCR